MDIETRPYLHGQYLILRSFVGWISVFDLYRNLFHFAYSPGPPLLCVVSTEYDFAAVPTELPVPILISFVFYV